MRLQLQDFRTIDCSKRTRSGEKVGFFCNSKQSRIKTEHLIAIMQEPMAIFEENYRVVAVDEQHLVIKGVVTGELLTIVNPDPSTPISQEDYPPGQLIALTDPRTIRPN
jgi:hypothetical protein